MVAPSHRSRSASRSAPPWPPAPRPRADPARPAVVAPTAPTPTQAWVGRVVATVTARAAAALLGQGQDGAALDGALLGQRHGGADHALDRGRRRALGRGAPADPPQRRPRLDPPGRPAPEPHPRPHRDRPQRAPPSRGPRGQAGHERLDRHRQAGHADADRVLLRHRRAHRHPHAGRRSWARSCMPAHRLLRDAQRVRRRRRPGGDPRHEHPRP